MSTPAATHMAPMAAPPVPSVLVRWWPLLGALAYAGAMAMLPGDGLKDRDNYLAYLENAPFYILGWLDGDWLQTLANEPLWILINAVLALPFAAEQALVLVIFVPALVVARKVLGADPRQPLLLLAFLLLPQVVKNHVIHLRQGAALAVFMIAWFAVSPRLRWSLLLTPFLHSSFFFVLMLVAVARLLERSRAPLPLVWSAFAALGVSIGLVLGTLVQVAGARQGEEIEFTTAQGISGLGFLFWIIALLLMLSQSREFLRRHVLETGAVIFYLATYFLSPYTARVFESTLPLVLLSSLRMRGPGRLLFIAAMLSLGALQWLMMAFGAGAMFTEN